MGIFANFIGIFTRLHHKISEAFDPGELVGKNSVYAEHRQWCITFESRIRKGKRAGTLVMSFVDQIDTYQLSESECIQLLKAANKTWAAFGNEAATLS